MGSIGSWMSPSVRMTAAFGIGRQLATWLSCARSPSTSSVTAEQPRSACGRVASRLPGMMRTCCLYWLDDFMRRPWDRTTQGQLSLVLSGLAPLPLADGGLVGYRAASHGGVDADAVLGMRIRSRHGAARAHRPRLSPVPLPYVRQAVQ